VVRSTGGFKIENPSSLRASTFAKGDNPMNYILKVLTINYSKVGRRKKRKQKSIVLNKFKI
jgi:hypothetical protein